MTHTIETVPAHLPPLPPERLLAIARGLGRDAATWRALAHHDPDERWFLQLTSNPRFDVWLIGWHGHQGVDLHDHGGSGGAFVVVEGELLETSGPRDGVEPLEETRIVTGSARAFGPGHVHWVVNADPRRRDQRARVLAAAAHDGLLRERAGPFVPPALDRGRRRTAARTG